MQFKTVSECRDSILQCPALHYWIRKCWQVFGPERFQMRISICFISKLVTVVYIELYCTLYTVLYTVQWTSCLLTWAYTDSWVELNSVGENLQGLCRPFYCIFRDVIWWQHYLDSLPPSFYLFPEMAKRILPLKKFHSQWFISKQLNSFKSKLKPTQPDLKISVSA